MSYDILTFTREIKAIAGMHKWNTARTTELQAIATALGTDTTTHDSTIQTPPAGLQPGNAANTKFTNAVLQIVNKGKGGNLTTAAMASAITSGISGFVAPTNTTAPVVSGTASIGNNLTTTNGVWTGSPTNYTYQWTRGGAAIAGATAGVYALIGADSGTSVGCQVTAENGAGSATTPSNALAVA